MAQKTPSVQSTQGTPSLKPSPTPPTTHLRHNALGPFAIAFFVISAAGPLVAMAGGLPVSMLFGNGAGVPAMFLVATGVLLVFSVAYTAMALAAPGAGGFFAFAERSLGTHAAGAVGAIALFSYGGLQLGLYGLFGAAAKALIDPWLGTSWSWWAYALAALVSIAWLTWRQVDLSARVLGLLVAGEYGLVLLLGLLVVRAGGAHGLDTGAFSARHALSGSPAIGLMLCFAAFVGFEATTIYSEEARSPERTVPLATYCAVLLIGGFYTFSTWAVVVAVGSDHVMPLLARMADPTELLFDVARQYGGAEALPRALRVLFVTSTYASALAFQNTLARYWFAMGRSGLLWRSLGTTHPRHRSPHRGTLLQSGLSLVLLVSAARLGADPIMDVFTLSTAAATLGVLTLMGSAALAAWCQFKGVAPRRTGVRAAALLSLAAFTSIAVVTTLHFDVLTAGQAGWAGWLPALVPIAGTVGALIARHRAPCARCA